MLKHTLTAAALATVLAVPAYAQSMNTGSASQPPTSAQSAPTAPAEKTAPPMKDNSSPAMPAKPDTSAAADSQASTKQAGFVQQQRDHVQQERRLGGPARHAVHVEMTAVGPQQVIQVDAPRPGQLRAAVADQAVTALILARIPSASISFA